MRTTHLSALHDHSCDLTSVLTSAPHASLLTPLHTLFLCSFPKAVSEGNEDRIDDLKVEMMEGLHTTLLVRNELSAARFRDSSAVLTIVYAARSIGLPAGIVRRTV